MSNNIRQFENAVNMLVSGALREEDNSHVIMDIVYTLTRVAADWAENLDEGDDTRIVIDFAHKELRDGITLCTYDQVNVQRMLDDMKSLLSPHADVASGKQDTIRDLLTEYDFIEG